jgi:hypothetical protein
MQFHDFKIKIQPQHVLLAISLRWVYTLFFDLKIMKLNDEHYLVMCMGFILSMHAGLPRAALESIVLGTPGSYVCINWCILANSKFLHSK